MWHFSTEAVIRVFAISKNNKNKNRTDFVKLRIAIINFKIFTTMINMEAAQLKIQQKVSKEIDWFNESDERHFNGIEFVATIASMLLTAFLAGFVKEAEKKAGEVGSVVFKKLDSFIKHLFKGKKEKENELAAIAERTEETLNNLSEVQIQEYLKITENNMRIFLESSMPLNRAASLARVISQSIESEFRKKLPQ